LSRVGRFRVDRIAARRLLTWAAAALLLDAALKAMLAPTWQRLLIRSAGWLP